MATPPDKSPPHEPRQYHRDEDWTRKFPYPGNVGDLRIGGARVQPLAPFSPPHRPIDDREHWRGESRRRTGVGMSGKRELRGPRRSYRA